MQVDGREHAHNEIMDGAHHGEDKDACDKYGKHVDSCKGIGRSPPIESKCRVSVCPILYDVGAV